MTLSFHSTDQLPQVADALLRTFPQERFYAFFGKMGVGKTTLIKALCSLLGVEDNVCSPTFAIINEYRSASDEPIYHFDFYRLRSLNEAFDLGYEDYFFSNAYCFTEWTEKVLPLLPPHYLRIDLTETNGERLLIANIINE